MILKVIAVSALTLFPSVVPQSIAHKTNFACGLQPLAPLGCRVAGCICDAAGQNCQWQFACR